MSSDTKINYLFLKRTEPPFPYLSLKRIEPTDTTDRKVAQVAQATFRSIPEEGPATNKPERHVQFLEPIQSDRDKLQSADAAVQIKTSRWNHVRKLYLMDPGKYNQPLKTANQQYATAKKVRKVREEIVIDGLVDKEYDLLPELDGFYGLPRK